MPVNLALLALIVSLLNLAEDPGTLLLVEIALSVFQDFTNVPNEAQLTRSLPPTRFMQDESIMRSFSGVSKELRGCQMCLKSWDKAGHGILVTS